MTAALPRVPLRPSSAQVPLHLLAEGRKLPRAAGWLMALAAAVAAGLAAYLPDLFNTNPLFLFAGLVPLLMIAPFCAGQV